MSSVVWPIAFPDESLYSWVARAAALNAVSDAFRFCRLISFTDIRSVLECQPSIPALKALGGDDDATRQFIDRLSLRNLARHFERAAPPAIGQPCLIEAWCAPTLGSVSRWKFCATCIESDLERYGVAYWHVHHQMGMVPICISHGTALKRYIVPPALSRDQLLLPQQLKNRVAVDLQALVSPEFTFWDKFSELCYSAFRDHSLTVTYATAAQSIQSALLAKRIVFSERSGRDVRFRKLFKEEMQPLLNSSYPARGYSHFKPPQTLRKWDSACPVDLDDLLMIVYWLFGDWNAFRERCQWEQHIHIDTPVSGGRRNELDDFSTTRGRHRAVCANYLRDAAVPTRADFLQAHPKSLRWLLEYDHQWLGDMLPLPSRKWQFRLFN